MLHARILYIAALLGALLFHTYYTGWFSWYLLMLAVILPWFSLLCSLRPMLRLRLQADMPSVCKLAEPACLRMGCAEKLRLSPPFRFESVIFDCMGDTACRQRIYLSGSKTAQIELPTHHAGAYVCSLEKGRVYDYLGIFCFPFKLPALGELQVFPETIAPEETPSLTQLTLSLIHI